MSIWSAAVWGVTGAVVADLVAFSVDVASSGYRWPWRSKSYQLYPRLAIMLLNIVIGALVVVAAAYTYVRQPLSAFALGFIAPPVLRRILIDLRRIEDRNLRRTSKRRELQIELEAERIGAAREAVPDSETSDVQGVSSYVADALASRRDDLRGQLRAVGDQPGEEQDAN